MMAYNHRLRGKVATSLHNALANHPPQSQFLLPPWNDRRRILFQCADTPFHTSSSTFLGIATLSHKLRNHGLCQYSTPASESVAPPHCSISRIRHFLSFWTLKPSFNRYCNEKCFEIHSACICDVCSPFRTELRWKSGLTE